MKYSIFCLIIVLSSLQALRAQQPVDYFMTAELSLGYAIALGPFAATEANARSGFARHGNEFRFATTVRKKTERWTMGGALAIESYGILLRDAELDIALWEAFSVPEADGQRFVRSSSPTWAPTTLTWGMVLGVHKRFFSADVRLMGGMMFGRGPGYDLNGPYLPPDLERFFWNESNRSVKRPVRAGWVMGTELNLSLDADENWGVQFRTALKMGKIKREMELFRTVNTAIGPATTRFQEIFSQPVRLWSISIGAFVYITNLIDWLQGDNPSDED